MLGTEGSQSSDPPALVPTHTADLFTKTGIQTKVRLRDFTRRTVFVQTDAGLSFGDEIMLQVLSTAVEAQVVYVATTPVRGAVVAFVDPIQGELVFELLDSDVPPRASDTLTGDETAVALLEHAATTDIGTAEDPNTERLFADADKDSEWKEDTAHDPIVNDTRATTQEMKKLEAAAAPAEDATSPNDPPELAEGNTVIRFETLEQYQTQHTGHIAHGGILVRGSGLAMGSARTMRFEIAETQKSHSVSVRVTFVGSGVIGFSIDAFSAHRAAFASLGEA